MNIPFLKKRNTRSASVVGIWPSTEGIAIPSGYHSLAEAPEVASAVWTVAEMISSVTIRLMQNTPNGDVRIKDNLAKKVDISPWSLGTRRTLIFWIVSTMLLEGEAFVLPRTNGGLLSDLVPMPKARAQLTPDGEPYEIVWKGVAFAPDEVMHFILHPDLSKPWKGAAPRVQLQPVVDSIMQTSATKMAYMSSEYKPPLVISVSSDADLSSDSKRTAFINRYLTRKNKEEPLIIPADLMNVVQAKPLSLTDLAIKDGIELDKKTVAALIGVPGFTIGAGSFNKDEHNTFVRTKLVSICKAIEQEATKKLLFSEERYFRMSTLRLYAYDMQTLFNIGRDAYGTGLMTGNEVRDWMELSPKEGLDDLVILENYIPKDRIGDQKKLEQEGNKDA